MVKLGHKRNKAYQEVRLANAARAAGAAFGCLDLEPTNTERIAAMRAARRMTAVFLPLVIILPFAAAYSFQFMG